MVTFPNSLRPTGTSLLEGGDAAGTASLVLSKAFQDEERLTELRADGAGLFKTVCVCVGGVSLILEMMMMTRVIP